MSIAETSSPNAKKLQPLQKWYMLFPENWAELALDEDWRKKRLKDIKTNRDTHYFGFWMFAGVTCFMMVLVGIGGFVTSGNKQEIGSRLLTLVLFANMAFLFSFQILFFLKIECERILLQLIDRLETEDSAHV